MQSLEDDDLHNFTNYISAAQESGADLNHQYGGESGYKTILHLALEEDGGLPYVEELLKVLPGGGAQTRRIFGIWNFLYFWPIFSRQNKDLVYISGLPNI